MAWLGEQFSSFKDKFTDFTKDVILNDTPEGVMQERGNSESEASVDINDLALLCQQQELQIKKFVLEKEELENSMVTLDEQNQEALKELLAIKQKLFNENKQLKKQLSEQNQTSQESFLSHLPLSLSASGSTSDLNDINFLANHLNILTILGPLRKCHTPELIRDQINALEKSKALLRTETDKTETDFSKVISRINMYIDYLNLVGNHEQKLLPVVEEISSILCKLHPVENGPNVNTRTNDNCDNSVCQFSINTQTDLFSQSTETQCGSINTEIVTVDSYCQTDDELECSASCGVSTGLSREMETLNKCSDALVQTDDSCNYDELKAELQIAISNNNKLKDNLSRNEELWLEKFHSQTKDLFNCREELEASKRIISEKDQNLLVKIQEISTLKEEIKIHSVQSSINNFVQNSDSLDHCDQHLPISDHDKLLQQKLKTIEMEKNKLLLVLNEKSQECSGLKLEVHKLTNIVASEKQAILKLQKDNMDLKQVPDSNLDVDLTKEALKNLSRLVRDKDMEIEALAQKNSSLMLAAEQSEPTVSHMQSLIDEREELAKANHKFKAEREKIMVSYNTRDQECRQQRNEIKKLAAELQSSMEKADVLQQQHELLSHQYEEKQKFLANTQNEIVSLKQQISELKEQELQSKAHYGEMINQITSDTMTSKEQVSNKSAEIESLRTSLEEQHNLIQEKDCLIHELSQQVKILKCNIGECNNEMDALKKTKNDQTVKLSESEVAIKRVWDDKELVNQKLNNKMSELNLLKDHNERLSIALKEKEFSVASLEGKIVNLSNIIKGSSDAQTSCTDIDQILSESKEMFTKAQGFQRERDETILACNQSQQEILDLKSEMGKFKNNEERLKNELDRLRKHLLEIEEHYTDEALKAEVREKTLKDQITEIERTSKVSNSAVLESNHHAAIQVASLQEQIAMIAGQRDRAVMQMSTLEDKVQEYAASLSNLQLVLEQMQKGYDQKMRNVEIKHANEFKEIKQKCLKLQQVLEAKQLQLEESSKALEAASRLSEKLDAKEELIIRLKSELHKTEGVLKSTTQEISTVKSSSEGKVDRVVMKSLVLGYFSTPPGQKSEVVRLLARVLDFNQQEMEKAGIVVGKNSGLIEHKGLLSSFLGRLPKLGLGQDSKKDEDHASHGDQQSFTTLFVKFLENESQPIVPMPLPAEKMARELTSKSHVGRHSPKNPLLSTPERNSLLLGISSSFPTFSPISPDDDYISPAPAILQGVLDK